MQIVIEMDKDDYEKVLVAYGYDDVESSNLGSSCYYAIRSGTPLPKGHGRLIDADKLKVELECGIRAGNYEEGYEKYAHIYDMDDCVDVVVYADTIIEADKAESEE